MTKAGVGYTSLPISALLQAQQRPTNAMHDASPMPTPRMVAGSADQPSVRQFAISEPGSATIHDKLDLARERHRAMAIAEARQRSHTFDAGELGSCTIRSVSNGAHSLIPIVDLDQLQLHASPAVKTKEFLRQFAPTLVAELRVLVAGRHSFGTQQYCVAVPQLCAALELAIEAQAGTSLCAHFSDWLQETFAEDFPEVGEEPEAPQSLHVVAESQPELHVVPAAKEPAPQAEEPKPFAQPSAQVSALFPKLAVTPCETSPWSRSETVPASGLIEGPSANPMLQILMDRFVLEKRKGDVFIEVRQLAASSAPAACSFVEPATCSLAPDLLAALITARRSSGHEVTVIQPGTDHDDYEFWQRFGHAE